MEHMLVPSKGARKAKKRAGRGDAAGRGSTAGRGMKGQKSRSGAKIRPGFEGGQMSLIKGLPMKRGFTNIFKTHYSLVKLETLDQFEPGERITPQLLLDRRYLRNLKNRVKILGDGQINKALTVVSHKFSRTAREKIEAAGGSAEDI
jgi:large subunit ribosomal protein L15